MFSLRAALLFAIIMVERKQFVAKCSCADDGSNALVRRSNKKHSQELLYHKNVSKEQRQNQQVDARIGKCENESNFSTVTTTLKQKGEDTFVRVDSNESTTPASVLSHFERGRKRNGGIDATTPTSVLSESDWTQMVEDTFEHIDRDESSATTSRTRVLPVSRRSWIRESGSTFERVWIINPNETFTFEPFFTRKSKYKKNTGDVDDNFEDLDDKSDTRFNGCSLIKDLDMLCKDVVFNRSARLSVLPLPLRVRLEWRSRSRLSIIFYAVPESIIQGYLVQVRVNDEPFGQFSTRSTHTLQNCDNGFQNTVCSLSWRARRFVSLIWIRHYDTFVDTNDLRVVLVVITSDGQHWKRWYSLPQYVTPPTKKRRETEIKSTQHQTSTRKINRFDNFRYINWPPQHDNRYEYKNRKRVSRPKPYT